MTTIKLTDWVCKDVSLRCGQASYLVTVVEIKVEHGFMQFLVRPIAGSGEQWVDPARCTTLEGVNNNAP